MPSKTFLRFKYWIFGPTKFCQNYSIYPARRALRNIFALQILDFWTDQILPKLLDLPCPIGPGLDWQSGPWADTPESELIWTVCLSRGVTHATSPPGRWRKFRLGVAVASHVSVKPPPSLRTTHAPASGRRRTHGAGLRVPVSWSCTPPRLAVPPIWRTWLLPKAWRCPRVRFEVCNDESKSSPSARGRRSPPPPLPPPRSPTTPRAPAAPRAPPPPRRHRRCRRGDPSAGLVEQPRTLSSDASN